MEKEGEIFVYVYFSTNKTPTIRVELDYIGEFILWEWCRIESVFTI